MTLTLSSESFSFVTKINTLSEMWGRICMTYPGGILSQSKTFHIFMYMRDVGSLPVNTKRKSVC